MHDHTLVVGQFAGDALGVHLPGVVLARGQERIAAARVARLGHTDIFGAHAIADRQHGRAQLRRLAAGHERHLRLERAALGGHMLAHLRGGALIVRGEARDEVGEGGMTAALALCVVTAAEQRGPDLDVVQAELGARAAAGAAIERVARLEDAAIALSYTRRRRMVAILVVGVSVSRASAWATG